MFHVVAVLLEMLTLTATVHRPAPSAALSIQCAEADLIVLSLIEWHGQEKTRAGAILREAFLTLTRARQSCEQGRVDDALASYRSLQLALDQTE